MTEAESLISELTSALAEDGETITLRRTVLGPNNKAIFPVDVETMAIVRGYQPYEISAGSGIMQQDVKIVLSPADIELRNWPGTGAQQPGTDKRIPVKGDIALTSRGPLTVQAGAGIVVQDVLVRIELQARGRQT
jgi:hypothetical protein